VFVFKDESEAQRQPLNFPTHSGIILVDRFFFFLFFFRWCVRTLRARSAFERNKETFSLAKLVRFLQNRDDERMREREEKRREKEHKSREIESRPITGAAPFHLSS
jgi:hypothetical protein